MGETLSYRHFSQLPLKWDTFAQKQLLLQARRDNKSPDIEQLIRQGNTSTPSSPGLRKMDHRMILNLKSLNKNITHHHFKMNTVLTAVRLMRPGCFMASIDLKDAYHSVSIHSDFQKYLKFSWRGQLYKFACFPNGLAPCPRQFTKLLKPVFSTLRKLGHISVVYIDDTWLTFEDYNSCVNNLADTITLLDMLGFVIHPEKSILIPTQEITFLGFIFSAVNMTLKSKGP